jgi:uncharacterized membrane protein YjfL (UPF0719 family)
MNPSVLPKFAVRAIAYSQWAYWSSLACAALSVLYIPPGSVRTFVILMPIMAAVLCVSVARWLYTACDEYLRTRLLRSVTITALVVALGSLVYFCLELLGFPRQSMIWVGILGWSTFNLQLLVVVFGASRAEAEPVSFRGASS